MDKKYHDFFVIFVAFLFLIVLLIVPKVTNIGNLNKESKLKTNLSNIRSSMSKGYKQIASNYLSNGVINYVYTNNQTGEYVTFFLDNKTGDVVSYKAILKNNAYKDFDNKEKELLNLKYPKFIIDAILKDNVTKYVEVKDNEIVIHYYNVVSEPFYSEPVYLVINNNEVSDLLDYTYSLDDTYQNESAYDFDPTKQYIAFTFDDGPSRANTIDIVNYLNDNKAHATFFELGNFMVNNQDIVKYVKENGMEVGSHTYSHINLKKKKIDKVAEEIDKTNAVYKEITGEDIKLVRTPYGAINNKIRDTFDYSFIMWSVDTLDWKYKDSNRLYDYVVNNVKDGDIVLMHDIHATTKEGVERILPELYVRGYRVVSVSELSRIKNIELETHKIYRSIR